MWHDPVQLVVVMVVMVVLLDSAVEVGGVGAPAVGSHLVVVSGGKVMSRRSSLMRRVYGVVHGLRAEGNGGRRTHVGPSWNSDDAPPAFESGGVPEGAVD